MKYLIQVPPLKYLIQKETHRQHKGIDGFGVIDDVAFPLLVLHSQLRQCVRIGPDQSVAHTLHAL